MKRALFTLLFTTAAAIPATTSTAGSVSMDLWQHQGSENNVKWTRQGSDVLKTQNRGPSYYISNENYGNHTITGEFGVKTWADDDFIGFVFGYQQGMTDADTSFYLFHWKQAEQNGSKAGFTLADVTGLQTPSTKNAQQDKSNYDVLDTYTGSSKKLGWQDETYYGYSLIYTPDLISISIRDLTEKQGGNGGKQFGLEGTEIFNLEGQFATGRFGFFNMSQTKALYRQIDAQEHPQPAALRLAADPVAAPTPAAASAGLLGATCLLIRRKRGV